MELVSTGLVSFVKNRGAGSRRSTGREPRPGPGRLLGRADGKDRSDGRVICLVLLWLLASPASGQDQQVHMAEVARAIKAPLATAPMYVLEANAERAVPPSTGVLTLRPGQMLSFRASEDPKLLDDVAAAPGSHVWQLPFGLVKVDAGGLKSYLRLVAEVEGGGLVPASGRFRGSLALGLRDSADPAGTTPLRPPVRVLVTADGAVVNPADLTIAHTNLPYERVVLETPERREQVLARICPSFDTDPVVLAVPVRLAQLVLRASPERIQGWGLQTTRLTVSLIPPLQEKLQVQLSSDVGQPDPHQVTLEGDGAATAELRSSGLSGAHVQAESAMSAPASVDVEFEVPLAFLASTLIGGAVGALIRGLVRRRSNSRSRLPTHVMTGLLAGVVVAAGFAVGVNLLGVSLAATYGEAASFVVAALGAYAGTEVLKIGS